MKKKVLFLLLAVILCFGALCVPHIKPIEAVSALSSSAKGMCVIEKDSKRILYSKNENLCLPMASTNGYKQLPKFKRIYSS